MGRREHSRPNRAQRSFFERYRGPLLGVAIGAVVILAVGFVFVSASAKDYSCSNLLEPASSTTGQLGQPEEDMGRHHVPLGNNARYTFCPPASGDHYNASGHGPINPVFYGPDDPQLPQGWIHNLEHGAMVILYNCTNGCDDASLQQLQQLAASFPPSPICQLPRGILSPVITRFDDMKAKFAAVVWDRVLFQDQLNTQQLLDFYKNYAERGNPEPQCAAPSASPAAAAPAPASPPASPEASPATSGSAAPSPS